MKAVEMVGIGKRFGDVKANDDICLGVEKNSVHCLLGENGSGKTTLMNILFGLYRADSGVIKINERPVSINGPLDAEKLGIGMVHQHFMLINQYTVWENVVLGKEPGKGFLDRATAKRIVDDIIKRYDFRLDIDKKAADLSVGMKQRVEIIKLLYRGADIIILDEPTAVLTPQEVDELFGILRQLVAQGKTVIFITHKLNEVMAISQRVTVLRKGRAINTVDTSDVTQDDLVQMMVGRQVADVVSPEKAAFGKPVLRVEVAKLTGKSKESFRLTVHEGEIVGIAGVEGNGQMELEELLVGVTRPSSGKIEICGADVTDASIRSRKEMGIGYIPSDRFKSAMMTRFSVRENFLLGYQDGRMFRKGLFIDENAVDKNADECVREYEIKLASIEQEMGDLSGGNQQKVILAREVSKKPKLVIAAQPSRGLDIGAIEYIHNSLLRLREENAAVLLISAELSEIMNLSDRIVVLYEGSISGEFRKGEYDEKRIGLAMAGGAGSEGGEYA